MQRHHTGSGRRTVIPADWSAHHRGVVLGTMTATVAIRHPGTTPGPIDSDTGKRTSTPLDPHYTGGARIQAQPAVGSERESAAQQVTLAGYLVTVELQASAGCKVGDILKVTAVDDNGDPALVDSELRVNDVLKGSLAWERDLIVLDNLG